MVGVPQEADGIDLAALDDTCKRLRREGRRIKFLYVVPNFQTPTGLLIGLAKRQRLLEWAERREVLIVEDDPYRELYFEDSATEADVRPIKADDARGRVVYLSSFSKTIAPGFRVAWITADERFIARSEIVIIRPSISFGERPVYCQITDTTGMLISGKMSVAMLRNASGVASTISMAITMNV